MNNRTEQDNNKVHYLTETYNLGNSLPKTNHDTKPVKTDLNSLPLGAA